MTSDRELVVWDSCVIIDALQKTEGRWDLIEPFLSEAEQGRLTIVVSEISVAEVSKLKALKDTHSNEQIIQMIKDWFDHEYVARRPVHAGISEIAAQIARLHNIRRAADATVIATAVYENIGTVHTFDGYTNKGPAGLLRFDGKIGDPPVTIAAPDPTQGTLWAAS